MLRGADIFPATRREDPFASRPSFPSLASPPTGLKMWRGCKTGKAVRSDRPAIERPWLCPWVPQSSLRDEPGRCRLRWTSRILVARIWHAGGLRASNVMNICSSDGTF